MKQTFNLVLGLLLFASAPLTLHGQSFADTLVPLTAAQCPGAPTAGTVTAATGAPAIGTGLMILTTPFAPVYQTSTTNAAGSTHTYTCEVPCQGRSTTGKGCSAFSGIVFYYGVQTTALTSQNATVCGTVAFPAPAASESASTVAFVSVPGTTLPVVGSANLGTTTAGAFFSTYFAITTPPAIPATPPYQKMFCTFSLAQSASAAQVVNSPGGTAFTTNTIAWFKRHSWNQSSEALASIGVDNKTARLLLAHYGVGPTERQLVSEKLVGSWTCNRGQCLAIDVKDRETMATVDPWTIHTFEGAELPRQWVASK